MEKRNMLTSLHASGSLQSHLDCSLCNLVHHFKVSIINLVSTLSHKLCLNETDFPNPRENQRFSANMGGMDADNTYICLFGRTVVTNLPAVMEKRPGCVEEWRAGYGLSAK